MEGRKQPFFILFANSHVDKAPEVLPKPTDFVSRNRRKNELEAHGKIRTLLNRIIEEKEVPDCEEEKFFLRLSRLGLDLSPDDDPMLVLYSKGLKLFAREFIEFLKNKPKVGGHFSKNQSNKILKEPYDEKNIRNLRRCAVCQDFFIAASANQKYCDLRCKRQVHQPPQKNAERMRKYRDRKREQKRKEFEELMIRKMIEGGIAETREEAIKIRQDDDQM